VLKYVLTAVCKILNVQAEYICILTTTGYECGNLKEVNHLGRPRRKWKNNINSNVKEIV
jgi:hypothetical protein